jgi:cytochrome P450
MTSPSNPVAAVTHPNPYPYYASLVADRPLYRDSELGLWVASSAEAVTAVLSHPRGRVRPASEPVPRALLGSPAADIFRHLVRMSDGAAHCPLKQGVTSTLETISEARASEVARAQARRLFQELAPATLPGALPDFAFRLSVHGVGSLLGVPEALLPRTASWMSDFVRCLAPASSPEQVERGKEAAGQLSELFRALLAEPNALPDDALLGVLARGLMPLGPHGREAAVANGIGLMSQAYEAVAGWVGNTLRALATNVEVRERVRAEPDLLSAVLQEVVRHDPPIQNTRRFLAEDCLIAGHELKAGDAILVVLAAANRDPELHRHPERFDPFRHAPRRFTFGLGAHGCPGEVLAATLARAGVEQVLSADLPLEPLARAVRYRPSANARVPLFEQVECPS